MVVKVESNFLNKSAPHGREVTNSSAELIAGAYMRTRSPLYEPRVTLFWFLIKYDG